MTPPYNIKRIDNGRTFALAHRLTHAVSRTLDDHTGANAAEGDATASKHSFEIRENFMVTIDVEAFLTKLDLK